MTEGEDRLVGTTIDGRFKLERLLGAGGMGKVYHATQLSVGRPVAVKVLRSDLSEIPSLQQRFFREAKVLASLHHPNIVGLVDFGRDEELGALYMVMQYVKGRSLTDLVNAGRLPLGVSLSIARQICSGLAEAHSAGIVHRDLKPDNVMLQTTAEGAVVAKILDFGIAVPTGKDETRFTATGAIVGSPYYMSPEQAQAHPVSPQSDLYAVGVILYEMVSGTVPFTGDTPLSVLFKTVNQRHTPIQELLDSPGVRGPLADLLDSLLEKDPTKRPPSAADLARRLDEIRTGVEVPTVGSVELLDTLVQPAVEAPPQEPQPRPAPDTAPTAPQQGDNGVLLGVLAVLLVLLLLAVAAGAGAWFFMSNRASESAAAPQASAPTVDEPPEAPTIEPEPELEPADEGEQEPAAPAVPRKPPQKPKKSEPTPSKPAPKPSKPAPRPEPKSEPPANLKPTSKPSCQGRTCAVSLTAKDAHYSCQNSARCTVDCPAGGCGQVCQRESVCTFHCSGGGCAQRCFPGTTCKLSCSGGNCDRTAFSGAKVTELD